MNEVSKKKVLIFVLFAFASLFMTSFMRAGATPNQTAVTTPASLVTESIHYTGVQATLKWLYNNAGTQVSYSINGVEISASVSNIVNHSVSVNFITAYGNNDVYSSSVIYKDHENYYIANATNTSENSLNMSTSDPGGNYYYFVPSSGSGSGSQTWTYWYSTGTWKSDSTADANSGTFYIDWSAPYLILFFGLPEVLFSGGWSASNSMGWSNPGQSWIPVSTGVSGSDQVGGYYGTVTTVTVDITWSYFSIII